MRLVDRFAGHAGLAAWRDDHPQGRWPAFRDESGELESLQLALADHQGWCCAYCEIRLTHRPVANLVVEHFIPKGSSTPSKNWHLDDQNLFACCVGGTKHYREPPHASNDPNFKANHSCDQRKLGTHPQGRMLDPRTLPAAPIFLVTSDGRINPDAARCDAHGVDADLARSTITFLNLDCPRLRARRAKIHAEATSLFNAVLPQLQADPERALPALRAALLAPDGANREAEFETTRLSVLGDLR